jgi:hypothetical protein
MLSTSTKKQLQKMVYFITAQYISYLIDYWCGFRSKNTGICDSFDSCHHVISSCCQHRTHIEISFIKESIFVTFGVQCYLAYWYFSCRWSSSAKNAMITRSLSSSCWLMLGSMPFRMRQSLSMGKYNHATLTSVSPPLTRRSRSSVHDLCRMDIIFNAANKIRMRSSGKILNPNLCLQTCRK